VSSIGSFFSDAANTYMYIRNSKPFFSTPRNRMGCTPNYSLPQRWMV